MALLKIMKPYIATPKLKTEEWDLVLSKNSELGSIKNDLELKRLENELHGLINKSTDQVVISNAYDYLGRLWAVKGNADNVVEMYLHGIRVLPSVIMKLNYGISLRLVGDLKNLKIQADKLFSEFPGNPAVLRFLINAFITLGDYIAINMVANKLIELNSLKGVDSKILESGLFDEARHFSDRAAKRGVSSKDISNRFFVALDTLKSIGYDPKHTGICTAHNSGAISIGFIVDDTPENMANAGFAIADSLVTKFDDPMGDLFTFSVMSPRKKPNDNSAS